MSPVWDALTPWRWPRSSCPGPSCWGGGPRGARAALEVAPSYVVKEVNWRSSRHSWLSSSAVVHSPVFLAEQALKLSGVWSDTTIHLAVASLRMSALELFSSCPVCNGCFPRLIPNHQPGRLIASCLCWITCFLSFSSSSFLVYSLILEECIFQWLPGKKLHRRWSSWFSKRSSNCPSHTVKITANEGKKFKTERGQVNKNYILDGRKP